MDKPLTPTLIQYLFGVAEILKTKQVARVRDIAEVCRVTGASVCNAMSRLAHQGYVHYRTREYITLTEKGRTQARLFEERCQVAERLLVELLHITPALAGKEARQLALCLSEETFCSIRLRLGAKDDISHPDAVWLSSHELK